MKQAMLACATGVGVVMALGAVTPVLAFDPPPPYIDAMIQAAANYRGADYNQMRRILACESNNWNPAVINGTKHGAAGEIGIAQILPTRGLGPLFESRGGDYSASDEIYFLAWALTHGLSWAWSCK